MFNVVIVDMGFRAGKVIICLIAQVFGEHLFIALYKHVIPKSFKDPFQ